MKRMKALHHTLHHQARRTPFSTHGAGPTSSRLGYRVERLADVVAREISRAMPGDEAREAALKATRLSDCPETYTPQVVCRTGWQDTRGHDADPVTGQPVSAPSTIG